MKLVIEINQEAWRRVNSHAKDATDGQIDALDLVMLELKNIFGFEEDELGRDIVRLTGGDL